jgi:hypothetical protein
MLLEADLIAKRATLRWLAQRHRKSDPSRPGRCGGHVPSPL